MEARQIASLSVYSIFREAIAVSGVESSVIPRLSLVTVQNVVGTSLVQLRMMGLFRNCRSESEAAELGFGGIDLHARPSTYGTFSASVQTFRK